MGPSKKVSAVAALLSLNILVTAGSQDQETSKIQPHKIRPNQSTSLLLPSYHLLTKIDGVANFAAGDNAWLLELEISGGLTGSRKSQVILGSDLTLAVDEARSQCGAKLTAGALSEVDSLAKEFHAANWTESDTAVRRVSVCQDCYKTTLTLYRREPDGRTVGYIACWDDTTRVGLAKKVAEMYAAVERVREKLPTETCGAVDRRN